MAKIILILIIIGAIIGGGYYFLNKSSSTTTFTPKTTPKSATQNPKPQPESPQVQITRTGFIPATIKVKKGAQVYFTNKDTNPHWVASDPHPTHTGLPGFDSKALKPDDSYSFTFEKPGTFGYHDHLNPFKLKGTVIVE